jgi:hypothetical protein
MSDKTLLIILGVVVVVVMYCLFLKKDKDGYQQPKDKEPLKEGFTGLNSGAIDNVGMMVENNYDLLQGADNEVPAHHFADLVDEGDHLREYMEPAKEDPVENPMERLERIQGKALMPRTSTYITPYNVDVSNPASAQYMVNAPRVQVLKSKYKDYSQASFIRGDIPIQYSPNVCLVSKTIQGRDDLRMDGLFTPFFNSLYRKYSGRSYKNLVQQVGGAGVASGYGGASGGTILDFQ